ncbi:hypothetical protein I5535_14835 [Rhodobacteraceae bacterium F11138]|nr:hypothetical protein [Rhodobacteraceae bacterium F11138]
MKTKWISIRRLEEHEFRTTLRKIRKDQEGWVSRYEILTSLEEDAIKNFMKFVGLMIMAYLISSSLRSGTLIKVQVQSFQASIPASYFLLASSFLFLISALSFCHLTVAMSLRIREGAKLVLYGFSPSIFGLIRGKKDDLSLGLSEFTNFFITHRLPLPALLSGLVGLSLVAALLPVVAFGIFLASQQLDLLRNVEVNILERLSSGFGLFLVILSLLYVPLFHIPLPTRKKLDHIRWNFLYPISNGQHPRAGDWIER